MNIKQEIIIKASQSTDSTRRVVQFPVILKSGDGSFHCDISQAIQTTAATAYDAFLNGLTELVNRVDSSTIIFSLENKSIAFLSVENQQEIAQKVLNKEIDIS